MKRARKFVPALLLALLSFCIGFATRSVWPDNESTSLSSAETKLVGTWRQFGTDEDTELDSIAFYEDRQVRIGHGGMMGRWRLSSDGLEIHSLECSGSNWGKGDEPTVYQFALNERADQMAISIDGALMAKLVREF